MTYETLAKTAQQFGTVYFVILFLAGCAYAFWPKKKADFQEAAMIPLEEDEL